MKKLRQRRSLRLLALFFPALLLIAPGCYFGLPPSAYRKFSCGHPGPGELQTTYFLDRLEPDDWGYFGLWGVTTGLLTGGPAASSINRAMALYRHFGGILTDQEPPAAR